MYDKGVKAKAKASNGLARSGLRPNLRSVRV